MTTTMIDQPVVEEVQYEFSLNDRCDALAGSQRTDGKGVGVAEQAYYRATKGDLELLFCRHHFNQHAERLTLDGWSVQKNDAVDNLAVRHNVYIEVDG